MRNHEPYHHPRLHGRPGASEAPRVQRGDVRPVTAEAHRDRRGSHVVRAGATHPRNGGVRPSWQNVRSSSREPLRDSSSGSREKLRGAYDQSWSYSRTTRSADDPGRTSASCGAWMTLRCTGSESGTIASSTLFRT